MYRDRFFESGQAVLIVVLVMVVVLTVGLSVVFRSVTNLRLSTEEQSSQRAFSAAEAGIEQALKQGCISPTPPGTGCASIAQSNFIDNSSGFSATITSLNAAELLLNGGTPVVQDDGADVWLSRYPDYANQWSGNLIVLWGTTIGDCNNAALEVVVISGASKAAAVSKRYVFDPCAARRGTNNFAAPVTGANLISGTTFNYSATIPIASGFIARVVPIYFSSPIGLRGKDLSNNSLALPSQGTQIVSTGTSGSTQRRVNLFQGYPEIPSAFFQYILFSPIR